MGDYDGTPRRKVVYSPRAMSAPKSGLMREHRIKAEKALEKKLPKGAVVHHHSDTELVICEDQAYHMLLEKRTKALRECGHVNWAKCRFCGVWGPPEEVKQRIGWNNYHLVCCSKYDKLRRRSKNVCSSL